MALQTDTAIDTANRLLIVTTAIAFDRRSRQTTLFHSDCCLFASSGVAARSFDTCTAVCDGVRNAAAVDFSLESLATSLAVFGGDFTTVSLLHVAVWFDARISLACTRLQLYESAAWLRSPLFTEPMSCATDVIWMWLLLLWFVLLLLLSVQPPSVNRFSSIDLYLSPFSMSPKLLFTPRLRSLSANWNRDETMTNELFQIKNYRQA